MQQCLDFFPGVDRTVEGYEGLLAAQQCLPDDETRDAFARRLQLPRRSTGRPLARPGARAVPADYRGSRRSTSRSSRRAGKGSCSGTHSAQRRSTDQRARPRGRVRDDLDTIVLDADVLEDLLLDPDPKKAKEVEVKIIYRLRKHARRPALRRARRAARAAARAPPARAAHEPRVPQAACSSSPRTSSQAERELVPEEEVDRGKAALTELFEAVKNDETPIIVERVVDDIDDIVVSSASTAGSTPTPASARSSRRCAGRSSSTSSTAIRSSSRRPTATSSSTTRTSLNHAAQR